MKYYIFIVFISLFFFQSSISAANSPTSKPECAYDRFHIGIVPIGDLGVEGATLIESSILIQRAMEDLFGSLDSCRENQEKFIRSIEGKETFTEYLEREKDTIGDENKYNMNCDDPFDNILTKLRNARPNDAYNMNIIHRKIINKEEEKLFNSSIHFENELRLKEKNQKRK
jgi:hypothetical protein